MLIIKEKVCDIDKSKLRKLFDIMNGAQIIYDYDIETTKEICEKSPYGVRNSSIYTIYIFPRSNENKAIEMLLKHLGIEFKYGNC